MAGGSRGSADLMRTCPRLSGRSWQTAAMKPGNGCSAAPTVSALKMRRLIWTSGVAADLSVRKNPPAYPAPIVSSPLRARTAQSGGQSMAPAVDDVVHGDRLGAAVLHADLEMVLQVGADARHVGDHVDAEGLQQARRSHTRELQELRRVERAAGDDDLAFGAGGARLAALLVFDPDGAAAVEQDAPRQRVGHHGEIWPAPRRPQVAHRRRPTASVARRQLIVAGALLGRAIEVVIARKACLLHRCQEGLAQGMWLAHIGDREGSADAMPGILAALLVLGAAEIGKHVGEAPAGVAELAPMIEILVLTADIEEAVDGTGSAQHLAARLDDPAIVELGLRLRTVQPVDLGVGEQLSVAERDVNPDVAILAAGFEEKHAMATRRGQAMREHAAGAAGADDDVVERFRRPFHGSRPPKLHGLCRRS